MTLFGYTLKLSDTIALCLIITLGIILTHAINTDVPYTWKWHIVADYFAYQDDHGTWQASILTHGLLNTIRLFIYTTLLAIPLALILTTARLSKNQIIATVAMLYINTIRNVPVLVFLFVFYFFVSEHIFPMIGITRDVFTGQGLNYILFGNPVVGGSLVAGFICLALFESVFFAEILRGAIQSIPRGQPESATALGLTKWQTYRHIIIPQALSKSYPALAGQTIIVLKNTSIASIVSVQDLMFSGAEIVVASKRIFEIWITVGILYFVLCYGLECLFKKWENKYTQNTH